MKAIALLLFISFSLLAQDNNQMFSLSFGNVEVGESRMPIDLNDFKIISSLDNKIKYNIGFLKKSVQWIRTSKNLLTPRARLGIFFQDTSNDLSIKYLGQSIIPTRLNGGVYAQIYVSLFSPAPIVIVKNGQEIGEINIEATPPKSQEKTTLIDYSCSRYGVEISGVENEYISIGCRMHRMGKWGKEIPRLEVFWTSTNLHLKDLSEPPYLSVFTRNSQEAFINVIDKKGLEKTVKISVNLPDRIQRLNTAIGLGPYTFEAKMLGRERSPKIAPSFMLYGNLNLSQGTSIRMFDALVWQDSIFNNFGFYFAYDLAKAFDGRVELIPLLGVQGLTFKYNKQSQSFNHMIYPQGFELVLNHAFGIENYLVVYGMFLSTSDTVNYKNLWLRWGKKYFWEINFIQWGYQEQFAEMYGLSIGIPFMKFF